MKSFKLPHSSTFYTLLTVTLLASALFGRCVASSTWSVQGSPDPYVFYAYAPPTVMNWTTVDPTISVTIYNYTRVPAELNIIGVEDQTRVEVYNLTDKSLTASFTVNRMQLRTLTLGSPATGVTPPPEVEGSFVKVVSDKLVSVLLTGGGYNEMSAYYPSTDGGYAGKEFIFKPVNGTWEPQIYVWEFETSVVWGVENAHVTVYDAAGAKVTELDVAANAYRMIKLRPDSVYRLVSTGRVMVAGVSRESFMYAPSATGGFIGKTFYGFLGGVGGGDKWIGTRQSFIVIALENCEVNVYNLNRPGWQIALQGPDIKKTLRAGEYWFDTTFLLQAPTRIDSTGKIIVIYGAGGYGWGVSFAQPVTIPEYLGDDVKQIVVRAGEEFKFYAPTSAVVFSHEDADVMIDGSALTMDADDYQVILGGMHTVQATGPLTVEVLSDANFFVTGIGSWDFQRRLDSWATYLISTRFLEVTYQAPPTAGSITELLIYIAPIVAIPIIIVAVVVVWRRRRARARGLKADEQTSNP